MIVMDNSRANERQAAIGVTLAVAIIGGWLAGHVAAVWFLVAWEQPLLAVILFAWQTWLSVGLFIVAHDAMHGSLAPGMDKVNRGLGSLALRLYIGFSYDRLYPKHHAHHNHVGSADDPDFDPDHPSSPTRWYLTFMRRYLDRYVLGMTTALFFGYAALLWMVGGPERAAHIFFWVGPSLIASMQLFYFGTYRPHCHVEGERFVDEHNSRSNDFGPVASLFSCFHFGYHREHHVSPGTPWWRLPAKRRELKTS